MANKISVDGKDLVGREPKDYIPLETEIADDIEVCGFGQPITARLAKNMFQNYYDDYKALKDFLEKLNDIKKIEDLQALLKDNNPLSDFLDPKVQIISGVFGKEILLQILAQKNCEGIRYAIGKIKKDGKSKLTLILFGVSEVYPVASERDVDGVDIHKSEPLKGKDGKFDMDKVDDSTPHSTKHPLFVEVHRASKSVGQIIKIAGGNADTVPVTNTVFGMY